MSTQRDIEEQNSATKPEDAMGDFDSAMDYMSFAQGETEENSAQSIENNDTSDVVTENPMENVSKETDVQTSDDEAKKPDEEVHKEEKGALADSDIVSEFAPTPIKIPKYDREKEQKRAEKENEKNMKRNAKKNRERREKAYKILFVIRTILIFVLLVSVASTMLYSLLVKMNTTQYAMETAIRNGNPGKFIVGAMPEKAKSKLRLEKSAPNASLIDVLRDNKVSDMPVTYADIEGEILKSSYPRFLARVSNDVVGYFLFGDSYNGVTEKDVAKLIGENAGLIRAVTGRSLGETAANDFAGEIKKSRAFKELSAESVQAQAEDYDTQTTAFLFSTLLLICLVAGVILLIILTLVACKGFAYKMIGWSAILSGVAVAVAGYFTTSLFDARSFFVKSVIDVLVKSFNKSALIWGGIVIVAGIIVMMVGKAMNESYDSDDYDDEDDYIDEIGQAYSEE